MKTFKRAFITGIAGSGGSYLAEHILDNVPGVEVGGTSRWHSTTTPRNLNRIKDKIDLFSCDLTDLGRITRILDQYRPDVIFHIASLANVRDSFDNPIAVINNNINITLNLLEAVRILKEQSDYNPVIQLCSTSEVYGDVDPDNVPINESCPIQPVNPYASSKLCQDNLGLVYYKSFGLNIIRTRMFTYLNARRTDLFATAFAKQIVEIEKGEKDILRHGNLESVRTLIDVRDAADSYWIAAAAGIPGEVYNIGGEYPVKVGEFLEQLKNFSSVEIKSEVNPDLLRPVDVTLQIPDCTKFRDHTGWKPKYKLAESVEFFLKEIKLIYG